jgi:hypothetical protein
MFNFYGYGRFDVIHTHMSMSIGVNPDPSIYIGDLMELFFCCGYRYMISVTGWYLSIHIPTLSTDIAVASRLTCETRRSLI